jgi:hypothetical protein
MRARPRDIDASSVIMGTQRRRAIGAAEFLLTPPGCSATYNPQQSQSRRAVAATLGKTRAMSWADRHFVPLGIRSL